MIYVSMSLLSYLNVGWFFSLHQFCGMICFYCIFKQQFFLGEGGMPSIIIPACPGMLKCWPDKGVWQPSYYHIHGRIPFFGFRSIMCRNLLITDMAVHLFSFWHEKCKWNTAGSQAILPIGLISAKNKYGTPIRIYKSKFGVIFINWKWLFKVIKKVEKKRFKRYEN